MKRNFFLITLSLIVISTTLTFVNCASSNITTPNIATNEESNKDLSETNKDYSDNNETANTSSQEVVTKLPYSNDDMVRYTDKELVNLLGQGNEEFTNTLGVENGGKIIKYDNTEVHMVLNTNGDYDSYFIKTKSNKISHLRGIKIGDSASDVISKFPQGNTEERYEMAASIFGSIDGVTSYSLCYGSKDDDINRGIIGYDSAGNIKVAKYTTELSSTTFVFENNVLSEIMYYELIN